MNMDTWLVTISAYDYKNKDKETKEKSISISTVRYEEEDIIKHSTTVNKSTATYEEEYMIEHSIIVNNTKSIMNEQSIHKAMSDFLSEINHCIYGVLALQLGDKPVLSKMYNDPDTYNDIYNIINKYEMCMMYRLFDTLINDIMLKCNHDISYVEIKPIHIFDQEIIDKTDIADITVQINMKKEEESTRVYDIINNIPVIIHKEKSREEKV